MRKNRIAAIFDIFKHLNLIHKITKYGQYQLTKLSKNYHPHATIHNCCGDHILNN